MQDFESHPWTGLLSQDLLWETISTKISTLENTCLWLYGVHVLPTLIVIMMPFLPQCIMFFRARYTCLLFPYLVHEITATTIGQRFRRQNVLPSILKAHWSCTFWCVHALTTPSHSFTEKYTAMVFVQYNRQGDRHSVIVDQRKLLQLPPHTMYLHCQDSISYPHSHDYTMADGKPAQFKLYIHIHVHVVPHHLMIKITYQI